MNVLLEYITFVRVYYRIDDLCKTVIKISCIANASTMDKFMHCHEVIQSILNKRNFSQGIHSRYTDVRTTEMKFYYQSLKPCSVRILQCLTEQPELSEEFSKELVKE